MNGPPPNTIAEFVAACASAGAPQSQAKTFTLVPFDQIQFDGKEEWRVKKLLPKQGVAVFFGARSTFKSFGAMDCGLHVACGWNWAGRRVLQSPVIYIAAEGAAGVRKRKMGFELQHAEYLPDHVPFYMVAAAPNLGTGEEDLNSLIAATESNSVAPRAHNH